MSKKVALVLSDTALEIIEQQASGRERGAWVSAAIVEWQTARWLPGAGALERVEARLARLEDAIRALRTTPPHYKTKKQSSQFAITTK